jgi:hypothetical protein
MNATPFIPPLDPRDVKVLVRQIRVLRYDYPNLSDDELIEEWSTQLQALVEDGRESPFVGWLKSDRFRQGFQKALDAAARQDAQKAYGKAQRQRFKESKLDKEPATERQQRFVKRLADTRQVTLETSPDAMSKLAASRLIESLLETPPATL